MTKPSHVIRIRNLVDRIAARNESYIYIVVDVSTNFKNLRSGLDRSLCLSHSLPIYDFDDLSWLSRRDSTCRVHRALDLLHGTQYSLDASQTVLLPQQLRRHRASPVSIFSILRCCCRLGSERIKLKAHRWRNAK